MRVHRRWAAAVLLCAAAAVCPAQSQLPREVIALARIQQKMKARLSKLPDYTCLETIERSTRPSPAHVFKPVDTVRLEVAHLGGKEVYSWPGAREFQEKSAADLVGLGTISEGEFASHLRSVFVSGASSIAYHGEEELNGRKALRYDFRVPLLFSRWFITVAGRTGAAASRGSFWADAETSDLLRLEVYADEIPPDLPVEELVTTIEYAPVQIGAGAIWLPQTSEVSLTDMSGRQNRNHIEFSHCRQYSGQSVISFEESVPSTVAGTRQVSEVKLPPRLALWAELESDIDSKQARVGDLISARLLSDSNERGIRIVPKGAVLHGRIRRLEKYDKPMPHFVIGLEFSELEFDGKRAQFFGQLDRIDTVPGLTHFLSASSAQSTRVSPDLMRHVTQTEKIRAADLPGVGTFFMKGEQFRLPRGLRMTWLTVDPRR